jgi:outer membrane murein-binding lipoprotein Lpp
MPPRRDDRVSRDDDSDPGKALPVILERTGAMREKLDEIALLVRDLDARVRTVEKERSQSIVELHDRMEKLEQWRRDIETAKAAEAKATEPWRAIWKRAIEVIVVLSVGGAAAAAWRVIVGH